MAKKMNTKITPATSYNLLKTSWTLQTRLFFEHSTLHGVRYIAEIGRPIIEKLLWFICVAVGAIATMVIIVSLWEKFQTNPTITGLDTDFHNWDVPFPAITVCQTVPSNESIIEDFLESHMAEAEDKEDIKDFLLKLTQLSYETLKGFKDYTSRGYIADDVDLKKFVFQLMNPCTKIFSDCVWKAEAYECCDGFYPVFTESGFCYSFNSRHYEPGTDDEPRKYNMFYIKETDTKWSLKFLMKTISDEFTMPIYIHNSDEVPGIDVKPQHVWDYKVDRISFSVKQTYTTDDARQLTIKQRHCIFEQEVKLKIDNIYSFTACTQQCRMDTAVRICGCVPHFYPENMEHNYRHCRLKELVCLIDNLDTIISIDKCKCELGCSNTVYEVEKLNENAELEDAVAVGLESEFVSWPMVRYKREVLFGWVDLLVSFGGIAGLFLGFSLLSGVEVIYYFTIRACCMVYKERDELERIQEDERHQTKPDYDLSLVPYFVKKPINGQGKKSIFRHHKKNINIISKNMESKKSQNVNPKNRIIVPPYGIEFIN